MSKPKILTIVGTRPEIIKLSRVIELQNFYKELPSRYLVAPNKAVIHDPMVHPRFIKKIAVRQGDQTVGAKIVGYGTIETAVIIELAKPLKSAKPLVFDSKEDKPGLAVRHYRGNGRWNYRIAAVSGSVIVDEANKRYIPAPYNGLILDKDGVPMGLSMSGYLHVDGSWKGSPLKTWATVSAKQMTTMLDEAKAITEKGILRVKLNFRSPKKTAGRSRFGGGDGGSTERNVLGVLTKPGEIMVLTEMSPKVTARLEKVTVYPPTGDPVEGKFAHTLTDYGCLLVKLDKPLPGAVKLSKRNIFTLEDQALPAADIRLHGEKLEIHYAHQRIGRYSVGWRKHVYPSVSGAEWQLFLFDADGALAALPISRREKVSVKERWGGRDGASMTAVTYLSEVFADLAKNVDPSKVPLTEAEEERLAWLGLVMQSLDQELARIKKIAHLTRDGAIGGVVSYVYPNSPAAKAGIEPGYILIRLHVEGEPKPLEVQIGEYGFSGRPFPWDRMDDIPERFFDRIPSPWPSAENSFTRQMTDLGFGKKFTAEFWNDGKILKKDFTVVQSPNHYGSAARHRSK